MTEWYRRVKTSFISIFDREKIRLKSDWVISGNRGEKNFDEV